MRQVIDLVLVRHARPVQATHIVSRARGETNRLYLKKERKKRHKTKQNETHPVRHHTRPEWGRRKRTL
jgi:hypothetical protein